MVAMNMEIIIDIFTECGLSFESRQLFNVLCVSKSCSDLLPGKQMDNYNSGIISIIVFAFIASWEKKSDLSEL